LQKSVQQKIQQRRLAILAHATKPITVLRISSDREALRILLVVRQEVTEGCTAQAARLRALLLAGDDTDRRAARTTLSGKALAALAERYLAAHATREQAVRQAEIRRLAEALGLSVAQSALDKQPERHRPAKRASRRERSCW
jgi:hypothetical protein